MPELGDGDGEGGGGGVVVEIGLVGGGRGEEGVIDVVECVVVFEGVDSVAEPDAPACISLTMPAIAAVSEAGELVAVDCASTPDAADCMSPTMPARAAVTEDGNADAPDGSSTCVNGQDPSLFA